MKLLLRSRVLWTLAASLGLGCTLLCPVCWADGEKKQPVYLGARVCGECHDGPEMGHQHSKWLLSKHARAYASLSKPEAKLIAKWSGIPQEPQKAPMCLGCHATAHDAEPWEMDDTFTIEDGVQCEKCHGPGSEYAEREVMLDAKAAMRAGLQMPSLRDCLGCHKERGSHTQVLKRPPLDIKKALQQIAHPTPRDRQDRKPISLPKPGSNNNAAGQHYLGSTACGKCHDGPKMGYQFSRWRMTRHAQAYAVLSTPEATQFAKQMGISGDPQRSPRCLECHATAFHRPGEYAESFALEEGVGCESCHGPGSEHARIAAVSPGAAAKGGGLLKAGRESCARCHDNAHQRPFAYQDAFARIVHPTKLPPEPEQPRYKTPLHMALRPDGRELFVTCESAHSVIVIDMVQRRKVAEIAVGGQPTEVCFSPDGQRAYVSNRLDDSVSVIDVSARRALATVPVGDEPHGVLTDRSGRILYVANASSDSISVIDTSSLREIKRLAASRSPWSMARSPDGSRIYVTNALSRFVGLREPSLSEVTVIDTEQAIVEDRVVVPGANFLQGIEVHPSGRYALITLNRTKNLVPMTRLLQGWTITNGLGIIWADGRVDQVLLDEPHMCFPDPTDVAITPDGRLALVTSGGTDRVGVVDLDKLISIIRSSSDEERRRILPNHLGRPTEFIIKHIPTLNNPRGIIITPDGSTALVANALDDSLTVIDVARLEAVGRIDLGGPKVITMVRLGERIFNSAANTFQRQFSCHTCHPDGHVDGLTYDIEPDGIGVSPVDNRTLRGILDTAPFKWEGTNPSLSRQCGPRLAVFFTRIQPFTPEELRALDNYICTIPRPPNRYRPLGARLTEAQRRGKAIFERTMTADGRVIPKENRCVTCHFPPLYTDRGQHDVGTRQPLDHQGVFDTPHLNNIYDSAPYLHNGIANTLEEIWTRFNPEDRHGVTNDLTKDQLNDLIEYLRTL